MKRPVATAADTGEMDQLLRRIDLDRIECLLVDRPGVLLRQVRAPPLRDADVSERHLARDESL